MATCLNIGHGGRFGNQMFTIANAYAHSKRMKEEFILPGWHYANIFPNFKYIGYNSHHFTKYNEGDFSYRPLPMSHKLDLVGYFQSEKYFKEYEADIRELFYQEIVTIKDTCAIHIRRTDYLEKSDIHLNQSLEGYYTKAINLMRKLHKIKKFYIFSDDIEWCKDQDFFLPYDCNFIDSKDEMYDFAIMRSCHHFIIANSSYSWWAAWLSNQPNKTVIAPFNWLARHFGNDKDVICEDWIILK